MLAYMTMANNRLNTLLYPTIFHSLPIFAEFSYIESVTKNIDSTKIILS